MNQNLNTGNSPLSGWNATRLTLLVKLGGLVLLAHILICAVASAATVRASVGALTSGTVSNGASYNYYSSFNAAGTKMAFISNASNIVNGDTNKKYDVFVRDLMTGTTTRVSVATDGTQANADSYFPDLSADGTKVAFESLADNLVSGDTNGHNDVFVHDLNTGTTTLVSMAADGSQSNNKSYSPSLNADGTKVAFESLADNLVSGDTYGFRNIFVRDLKTSTTTLVSIATDGLPGFGDSFYPSLSATGTKIAFVSRASDLVANDQWGTSDVFVRDLSTSTTTLVSVSTNGSTSAAQDIYNVSYSSINPAGTKVVFSSDASNLVSGDTNNKYDIFVRDLINNTTTRVSVATNGTQANDDCHHPSFNMDGTIIGFETFCSNLVSGDTNSKYDVFVRDLTNNTTTRVSVANDGTQADADSYTACLNADGTKLLFNSSASNLVSGDLNGKHDVFVRDLNTGTNTLCSLGSGPSYAMEANNSSNSSRFNFSSDGTKVVFESFADNLVSGDTNNKYDIFVRDLTNNTTTRVSVATDGTQTNGDSYYPCLSADGTKVAFESDATNLVSNDTNGYRDVFLHDLTTGTTTCVNVATNGTQGNSEATFPSLSANGTKVTFHSEATNLVSNDTNGYRDVFLRDLTTNTTTRISVPSDGTQGNSASGYAQISADGRKVAFGSGATNFVSTDTNDKGDVFLRDLATGSITRISVASDGTQGNNDSWSPSLSADGTKVAFSSAAGNLVSNDSNYGFDDIFVRDLNTGLTTRVSLTPDGFSGNGNSGSPSLSADGAKVAFDSSAYNLVSNDSNGFTDVFVRDLASNITTRVSLSVDGTQGNQYSDNPCLNADGTKVAYPSYASNLIGNDTNENVDVFVSDVGTSPTISINDVSLTEGNSGTVNATFTVKLSRSTVADVTINYSTANGTANTGSDYTAANDIMTIPAGQTSGTINVSIKSDTTFEVDETFTLTLSNSTNATIADSRAIGTIINDDAVPTLSINDVSVLEGNSVNFTVTLSAISTQNVIVSYATTNGNATAPDDFTAKTGSITIPAGQSKATINIITVGDLLDELDETFRVNLSAPANATIADAQGIGTIADDDRAPSLSINNKTVTEGNSGTVNAAFTITLSAPSGQTVSVSAVPYNGTATSPGDYTSGGARLTFAPGETIKNFSVPVKGDLLDEPSETFYVILSAPTNASLGTSRGIGTITDDDTPPTIAIDNVSIGEGNSGQRTAVFRLKLSAPSGQVVRVNYATASSTATAGNDYVEVASTQVAFTTGTPYAYARVLVNGDLLTEANETFKVNLSSPQNATIADAQALGTILNDDSAPSLTINDVGLNEGNSGTKSLIFTVTLSKPSGQTVTVNYATANGTARSDLVPSDYVSKSGSLSFSTGQISKTISVAINGDTQVEGSETLYVLLSAAANASIGRARGTGTIINDDGSG